MNAKENWTLSSWKKIFNYQAISYPIMEEVENIQQFLTLRPNLTHEKEILELKQELIDVADGRKFIVQAGDCAELFENCNPRYIFGQLDLLFKLSKLITKSINLDVCTIGRIAGQYAKPRSSQFELQNNTKLVNYFGDMVNSASFKVHERVPNPYRMIQAYYYSWKTLQYLMRWEIENEKKIFTSHEALVLPYEQALTRIISDKWYVTSCHLPWVGVRTAYPDSAHIEYLRGINNPIAIKIGPHFQPTCLLRIIKLLNPSNLKGRLLLIYRFGKHEIGKRLPQLLSLMNEQCLNVILICDPMHGNTHQSSEGLKVRYVSDIKQELTIAAAAHRKCLLPLQGIHLEVSSDQIYECIEDPADKQQLYKTKVDPRLNNKQAEDVVNFLAQELLMNNA